MKRLLRKGESKIWERFTRNGLLLDLVLQEPPHTHRPGLQLSPFLGQVIHDQETTKSLTWTKEKIPGLLLCGPR